MDRQLLERFYKNKIRIKLNLKDKRYYTGTIIELFSSSLLFEDKYGDRLPFDLDSISYVDIDRGASK